MEKEERRNHDATREKRELHIEGKRKSHLEALRKIQEGESGEEGERVVFQRGGSSGLKGTNTQKL